MTIKELKEIIEYLPDNTLVDPKKIKIIVDHHEIMKILPLVNGSKPKAAEILGVDRKTVYLKIWAVNSDKFPNPFDAYFYLLENFKEEEIV